MLCCCGAGLMLACFAPPLILNHETMHNVWGIIEWLGNTLIFLLAGLIFGHRTLDNVSEIDWLYLPALFIILMLVRVLVVFSCYPLLKNMGHGLTVTDAIFICWAGLRGALGIVLALIVEINREQLDLSKEDADRFFFFIGGIATLTLLINATLAKNVLDYLGLIGKETSDKTLVLRQIRKRLRNRLSKAIDQMKSTAKLNEADVADIKGACTVFKDIKDVDFDENEIIAEIKRAASLQNSEGDNSSKDGCINLDADIEPDSSIEHSSRYSHSDALFDPSRSQGRTVSSLLAAGLSLLNQNTRTNSQGRNYSRTNSKGAHASNIHIDLLVYLRAVFLEIVRVRYWHHIEEGKLPRLSYSAQYLLYSIDVALDEPHSALCDWSTLYEGMESSQKYLLDILIFLDTWSPNCITKFKYWYGWVAARREKRIVYILTSFIEVSAPFRFFFCSLSHFFLFELLTSLIQ